MNPEPDSESRAAGLAWGLALAGLLAIAGALLQEPLARAQRWSAAEGLVHRQEYSRAIEIYEGLLAQWPDELTAHIRIGEIYLTQARWSLAEKEFQSVIDLQASNTQALLGAGKAAMGRGDGEEAISLWKRALEIDPHNSETHYLLGQAYLAKSELEMAKGELEQALLPWSGEKEAHYLSGLILALEDRDAAGPHLALAARARDIETQSNAREMLDFLAGLSVENPALAYAGLGQKYLELGQPVLAGEALRRSLALDPRLPLVKSYLGYVYFTLGDMDQAKITLLAAKDSDPQNPLNYFFLARVYRAQGDVDKALRSLEMAMTLDPQNPAFLAEKGSLAWEKRDYEGAREAYRQATELAPREVGFYLLRAEYHLSTLLWLSDGLEAAQRAVALAPGNAQAQELLGWAYTLSGRPDAALGPLQEALHLDSGRASAYYRLGETLVALGRMEEAQTAYQRALDLATDDFLRGRAGQALAELESTSG